MTNAPIYLTLGEFKRSDTYRRWRVIDRRLAAAMDANDLETEQRLFPEWAQLEEIVQSVYAELQISRLV